jgi:hypothetical protein
LSHSSGIHKYREFRLDSLRSERRLVEADHCDSSQPSAFSLPGLCLDASGKIIGLLMGFFGQLEDGVFASGYELESAG